MIPEFRKRVIQCLLTRSTHY